MTIIKKLVSCEIGPNFTHRDVILAVKLLLLLPFIYRKSHISSISTFFSDSEEVYFFDSGRTALTYLLQSLQLPEDSEVLIQSFSCVVVPNSVLQAKLKPVVVDISKKNYNISLDDAQKKLTPKSKILIVQYPFGIIPNLDDLVNFCNFNNLILIEDCAHSFGAKGMLDGKEIEVGNIGYGSIYSFGRDKMISSTVGGCAVINNPTISQTEYMRTNYKSLHTMNYIKQVQSLCYIILTQLFIRPFYYLFIGKAILLVAKKVKLIGDIYTSQEKNGTSKLVSPTSFPYSLSEILLQQLTQFPSFLAHRKLIAREYANNLNISYHNNYSYMRFPITIDSKSQFKGIIQLCKNHGILIGTWYQSLFIPHTVDMSLFNYSTGSLPNAEYCIDSHTLNLPTNICTDLGDVKKICDIIKSVKS